MLNIDVGGVNERKNIRFRYVNYMQKFSKVGVNMLFDKYYYKINI